jgi:hypothetical protein
MFLIACACLNLFFLICATRINVVFFVIFLGATLGFILAASARWCIAEGHVALAGRLVVVCAAVHYTFDGPATRKLTTHRARAPRGFLSRSLAGICY